MRAIVLPMLLVVVAACGAAVEQLPDADVGHARSLPHGKLLLFPEPLPERLLGHAVTRGSDGSLSIDPDLAPGCDVRVTRSPNVVEFNRESDLREATSVGGAYAPIASFEAKWGTALKAAVRAKNTEVVRAELSGPCGADVVSEVFIGTGERFILRNESVAGRASVGVLGVAANGGHDRASRQLDSVVWTEPQVYAFNTRAMAGADMLDIEVALPPRIVEGDRVGITVTTSEDAFLLVYYVDPSGAADPILPSNEEPRPRALKGTPFPIPTAAQSDAGVSFRAQLAQPGTAQKDRLLVYALRAEGDFKLLRDAIDGAGRTAAEIEASLEAKLQTIPLQRWKKRTVSYEIVPK